MISTTPMVVLVLDPSDSVTATSACSDNGYSLEVNGFVHRIRTGDGADAVVGNRIDGACGPRGYRHGSLTSLAGPHA